VVPMFAELNRIVIVGMYRETEVNGGVAFRTHVRG
jgi:hypothetical protein